MKKIKNRKGSALVIAVLLLGVISLLLTLVFTMVSGERNVTKAYTEDMEIFYDTESALNKVIRDLTLAKVEPDDQIEVNQYLKKNCGTGEPAHLYNPDVNYDNLNYKTLETIKVNDNDVQIKLSQPFFLSDADAASNRRTYTLLAEGHSAKGFAKKISVDVQGSSPLSDYNTYICGTVPRKVTFSDYYYNGKVYIGDIPYFSPNKSEACTFVKSFEYVKPMQWTNSAATEEQVKAVHNFKSSVIRLDSPKPCMEEMTKLSTLKEKAIAMDTSYSGTRYLYFYNYGGKGYVKVTQEFGSNKPGDTYALDNISLIYVDGDMYVRGQVNGRITVAATNDCFFNGDIVYVDNEGDKAMDFIGVSGTYYSGPAYNTKEKEADARSYYKKNPNYSGYSVLGLIYVGNGRYYPWSNYDQNIEIHAAITAMNESYSPYSMTDERGMVLFYGSQQLAMRQVHWNGKGYQWRFYNYDEMLLRYPPPFSPALNKPKFMDWREVSD